MMGDGSLASGLPHGDLFDQLRGCSMDVALLGFRGGTGNPSRHKKLSCGIGDVRRNLRELHHHPPPKPQFSRWLCCRAVPVPGALGSGLKSCHVPTLLITYLFHCLLMAFVSLNAREAVP